MSETAAATNLLAVEVGTSRVKLGWFPADMACDDKPSTALPITTAALPLPEQVALLAHSGPAADELAGAFAAFLEHCDVATTQVATASVNADAYARVAEALAAAGLGDLLVLDRTRLPIEVALEDPSQVGIDRLLTAVAVNRLRQNKQAAVVIDLGTAITVNRVDAAGVFRGGAILPGPKLAADALHHGTATLPQLDPASLAAVVQPPEAVGTSTTDAMAAGLFWGAVGAVRQLVAEVTAEDSQPLVVVTGGDAPRLFPALSQLESNWQHAPHLVLAGIAIAVGEQS